jgi:hypothetical protein
LTGENPNNMVTAILIEASRLGARLYRRNVGMGWIGQAKRFSAAGTVSVQAGDVLIRQARPFHNGEVGQSDTYGWRPVTITADMVGTVIAQHVEIEVKTGTGRESTEQRYWRECVDRAGGVAGVARSVGEVRRILG